MSLTSTDLSGGPPKKEGLTLMTMPTEILEAILKFAVGYDAGVHCDVEQNQRTVTWLHPWVAELLLVSKGFSEVAKKIVADQSVLLIEHTTDAELPMALDNRERFLRLDTFPKYLMDSTQHIEVMQARVCSMLPSAEMDVSAFPRLRRLVFRVGSLETMFEGLAKALLLKEDVDLGEALWPGTPDVAVLAASRKCLEMIGTFMRILVDPRVISYVERIAIMAELENAFLRPVRQSTSAQIFHASILRRLQSADLKSASLLYSRIATDILHISRDCAKQLKHDTELMVDFSTRKHIAGIIARVTMLGGKERLDFEGSLYHRRELVTYLKEQL